MQTRALPLRSSLTGLFAILAAGCAPATGVVHHGPEAPPDVSMTSTEIYYRLSSDDRGMATPLPATPDRIWTELPEVYKALGMEIDVLDPASRTVGSRRAPASQLRVPRNRPVARCAEGAGLPGTTRYRIQVTVTTTLTPVSAEETRVVTRVSGVGTPFEGTSTGQVACASTGELEQRIHQMLRDRLGLPQPAPTL